MTPSQSLFAHWYFHIPNLLMAAMMYTLAGRYVLSLVLNEDMVIMRVFNSVTNPVLRVVRAITPHIVPGGLLLIFAIVWLFVARIALFLGLALLGIRPSLG
jgi:hypothetical protein